MNGLPVRLVVALGYPRRLADLAESRTDANLAAANDLTFACRYFGEEWGSDAVGGVADLAELLRDFRTAARAGPVDAGARCGQPFAAAAGGGGARH